MVRPLTFKWPREETASSDERPPRARVLPWSEVENYALRNGGLWGELAFGGWALPMIMKVTWHDEPAMSFKDHREYDQMMNCAFDPEDEEELQNLSFLSIKADTVNLD